MKKKFLIALGTILIISVVASYTIEQPADTTIDNNTPDTTQTELEPNSSAMVDSIASRAKEAAQAGITDEQRDEAVNFIAEHYPDFYADNETMERAMYYGYLLEYAYQDDPNSIYPYLGQDTYQAIKYVYRNVETVEDEATQLNLEQIEEELVNLGLK